MNINKASLGHSVAIAAIACFFITWMNEGASLKGYSDLVSFLFVTKVVTTFVTLTGMNTYFASKTFRDPNTKTRASDSLESTGSDIREVLSRRRGDK